LSNQFKTCSYYFGAAIASLLISIIGYYYTGTINPDGVLYLKTAHAFINTGLSSALSFYNWPFYAILIAYGHIFFHISYLHSAMLLNIIFQLGITLAFMLNVKVLGGKRLTLIFAAIIILLQPHFIDYRAYIVRDFGYWCFYLFATYFFLKYFKFFSIYDGLLWLISMIIATLFRVEGVLFLVLTPAVLLFDRRHRFFDRLIACLKLYWPIAVIALLFLMYYLMFHHHKTISHSRVVTVLDTIRHFYQHPSQAIEKAIQQFKIILGPFAAADADKIFILGLTGYYLMKIITTMQIILFILAIYGWRKGVIQDKNSIYLVLLPLIFINILLTFYFLLGNFFLSGRYMMALISILLFWVPFSIEKIYNDWRDKKSYLKLTVLIIILITFIIFLVKLIGSFSLSHEYIKKSGTWLSQNNKENQLVITNNKQILYYAKGLNQDWKRVFKQDWQSLLKKQPKKGQYYAILVKHHELSQYKKENKYSLPLLKTFINDNGDRVFIYKIQ